MIYIRPEFLSPKTAHILLQDLLHFQEVANGIFLEPGHPHIHNRIILTPLDWSFHLPLNRRQIKRE